MGQANSPGRLEDKYFLQKVKLGQGSFGVVWRAVERQTQKPVAVKQMDKQALPRRGVRRQDVEREIIVMQAINHENVTGLYDTFEDQRAIYMVLEYCDGGDFGDKVKERAMDMREPEAAEWVRQICSAVAALHSKGVCHRDIKPDNFMVHGSLLKLTDFGLAIFLAREQMLNDKCGTPAFMAPEQHQLPRNSRGYSHPVDNWAAGVSMYMLMMGGRHPFLVNGQHLDERMILMGALDFTTPQRVFGIGIPKMGGLGAGDGRFSEPARDLCRRLVCPDAHLRLSAAAALQHPWLLQNCRVVAPHAQQSGPPLAVEEQPTAQAQPLQMLQQAVPGDLAGKLAAGVQLLGLGPFMEGRGTGRGLMQEGRGVTAANPNEADLQRRQEMQKNDLLRENFESQPVVRKQLSTGHQQQPDRSAPVQMHLQSHQPQQPQQQQQPPLPAAPPWANTGERRDSTCSTAAPSSGLLQVGARCRYFSSNYSGWIPAVVVAVNLEGKTYDLDCRPGAIPHNISPRADGTSFEAWPRGTFVFYNSSSAKNWLPAVVENFNEACDGSDATYNLDIRESASVDRIRIRFPP